MEYKQVIDLICNWHGRIWIMYYFKVPYMLILRFFWVINKMNQMAHTCSPRILGYWDTRVALNLRSFQNKTNHTAWTNEQVKTMHPLKLKSSRKPTGSATFALERGFNVPMPLRLFLGLLFTLVTLTLVRGRQYRALVIESFLTGPTSTGSHGLSNSFTLNHFGTCQLFR